MTRSYNNGKNIVEQASLYSPKFPGGFRNFAKHALFEYSWGTQGRGFYAKGNVRTIGAIWRETNEENARAKAEDA